MKDLCPFSRVTETCLSGCRRFDRKLRAEESSTRVHMRTRAHAHTHTHTHLFGPHPRLGSGMLQKALRICFQVSDSRLDIFPSP